MDEARRAAAYFPSPGKGEDRRACPEPAEGWGSAFSARS